MWRLRGNRSAHRRSLGCIGVVAVSVLVAGCGGHSAEGPTPQPSQPAPVSDAPIALPQPDHIVLVIFENKAYGQIVGSPAAPFLSSLARSGANFTNAHGEWHPSQPNYLALLSGSAQGISNDSCPHTLEAPNLALQLFDAGRSFAGYSEDAPSAGYTGCGFAGRYARKHNPWVNFTNIPATANLPLSALPPNLADLPTVAVLIPNLCNDMHDCPVEAGDQWAHQHLSGYLDWARTHNSLLIVTFDEDNGTAANHIPTLFAGPMVRPGDTAEPINHYAILRTIEDIYHLTPLGQASATAPITDVWQQPPPR